ncbi:MAG: hypothetical protein ACYC96_06370 [Fimbriimonadaceae bacterium]
MSTTLDTLVVPTKKAFADPLIRTDTPNAPPGRTMPFDIEPGFHALAGLWLYGNVRLLEAELASFEGAGGPPSQSGAELNELERQAEDLVLRGKILVTGIHNPAHMRVAVVPLRWGAPRIVVFSGGFHHHLGPDLDQEPFRTARLWRYRWDPQTDLAVSRRAPDKLPTYAQHNPTVDRLIARITKAECFGLRWMERDQLRVLV